MDDVPLLEIRNLEKTYEDGYRAVRGVSFTLEPGMLIMTGSITAAVQLQRGQYIKTVFSKLGSVEIQVV